MYNYIFERQTIWFTHSVISMICVARSETVIWIWEQSIVGGARLTTVSEAPIVCRSTLAHTKINLFSDLFPTAKLAETKVYKIVVFL